MTFTRFGAKILCFFAFDVTCPTCHCRHDSLYKHVYDRTRERCIKTANILLHNNLSTQLESFIVTKEGSGLQILALMVLSEIV